MEAVETSTGKMVSNIDQGVRDHEFQNKKKAELSLDVPLRGQSRSQQRLELLYEALGHPGWESCPQIWGLHSVQRG